MIFTPIETTHRNLPTGIGKFFTGKHHGLGKIFEKIRLGHLFRLPFVFRWHLTGIHHIQYFLPKLGVLKGVDLQGQVLQVHHPLLSIRIVAIHAMVVHQIEMLFGHDGLWIICIDRGPGQSKTGQKEGYFTVHA